MQNHLILIHGYSDRGKSFQKWKEELVDRGFPADRIHVVTYESLTDEVTIKDIAEGFDRALRTRAGMGEDEPFDAIVHSTGMLVIRAWLVNFPERRERLKRLIGIAPATFGSPLAHTGRSTLGAIFKGNKSPGADFLEAGKEVLFGLELASRFTWDLAHEDLIGRKPFYGLDAATPYVFIFCGDTAYGGLRRLVNEPGTDGTVRLAGCALNTRKITMDLTRPGESDSAKSRFRLEPWSNADIPLHIVEGLNHGTILTAPTSLLVDRVYAALQVGSRADFEAWSAATSAAMAARTAASRKFQQFVVHAIDERGDGIEDFDLQLLAPDSSGELSELEGFDMDVHVYQRDPSYRCFHVDLDSVDYQSLRELHLEVTASTGSRLVGYLGYDTPGNVLSDHSKPAIQTVRIDITQMVRRRDFSFFYPFTTTLVEFRLNREPLPPEKANKVCWFD
jgi:pimeloyl-ACP methyl ester carboxylesterase